MTPKRLFQLRHELVKLGVEFSHQFRHIRRRTVNRDTIFDPFMTCGTTRIAALKPKRQFIEIEMDKERFEIAQTNITRIVREVSTT